MNYLKEIITFYDRIEQSQLSASAVSLWHGLMYINNKVRWKKEFTAPSTSLTLRAGVSMSSFKRARKELVEKGYLHYESRGSNRAPVYRLVKLSEMWDEGLDVTDDRGASDDSLEAMEVNALGESSPAENRMDHMAGNVAAASTDKSNADVQVDHSVDQQAVRTKNDTTTSATSHSMDRSTASLYKHKQNQMKIKQNENLLSMDVRTYYTENFIGKLTKSIRTSIEEQVRELGEPLVMEAMKRAVERDKLSWGYANAICNGWKKKGISTLEQAHTDKEAFKRRHSYQGSSAGHQEVVPDWFKDRQKRPKPSKQPAEDDVSVEEVARMLARFSSKEGKSGERLVSY
ncbi:DnaD domain protein [Virgibacillus sp. NKC19-16]|uniref:DnaD domain-containing protein n=1 Tax=Virgibacillus salidurans TaxID=2831673 RepID=UPI001F39F51D|nr:DnaD domain protein [Virgibacillus sp. NKC19-16]UJL45784.1 DnaD domain protein [Virgibacillus sp. NKC19-16]